MTDANLFSNNNPSTNKKDLKKEKVVCLGKEFPSDDERRNYFREELKKQLPELKKIDGFPIGEDEDILNLSDPPYYTACPNPWLNDFIAEWEKEKKELERQGKRIPDSKFHVEEPYASDVSEGKNNPIYNAHSYHTKVPHPAIMRYILHYTQPGDIVFDGFAGTGMTGVAAQMCGNPDPELKHKIESEFKENGLEVPVWGERKAILGDLSPIASFIAYNYNTPVDVEEFEREAKRILEEVEKECGWMYETDHVDPKSGKVLGKGRINYVVWSDVFLCSNCNEEIVFWDVAVDKLTSKLNKDFYCPLCNISLSKRTLDRLKKTHLDTDINKSVSNAHSNPCLISYTFNGNRYEKKPDIKDINLINIIDNTKNIHWFPINSLPIGYNTRQPKESHGVEYVHQFYNKRSLLVASAIKNYSEDFSKLSLATTGPLVSITKMYRWTPDYEGGGPLSGTLYIPSIYREISSIDAYKRFFSKTIKILTYQKRIISRHSQVQNTSASKNNILENKIDYIFTDPPFGANIMYSELNFIWESWLKVRTNNKLEAIENKVQNKTMYDYQNIMSRCFEEYFRVLKPGKWMTVEFSNTNASVWNAIQTSIQRAGFVVANVASLDKQQGSFKAVTTPTAVKQDLVISCYKPSTEFTTKFQTTEGSIAVWDFLREHFNHLPVHLKKGNSTTAIIERSPKILYDRLISFYLMKGLPVPIDAKDFQDGLKQKFVERDGMYFSNEQALEYDQKKAEAPEFVQFSLLVTNESEAIEWLKVRLKEKPQKYQDIQPEFRIVSQATRKGDVLPELSDLLKENFIEEAGGIWRTPNLNEAKDRDILRTKALLKEFQEYVVHSQGAKPKKLKEVRVEALRTGFLNCWEKKEFERIVKIGDLIPQTLLLEDEQLLMYYDIAKDRV
jgi:DNA modification methylase/rubredoxin